MIAVESPAVIEGEAGSAPEGVGVVGPGGGEQTIGADLLYLAHLCSTWEDLRRTRLAADQRGLAFADEIHALEDKLGRAIFKALRAQPIWPWLSQFPGLGGVHTARLIARIGNPHRFPGQPCTQGHVTVPGAVIGSQCETVGKDDVRCTGLMMAPRLHTGVRSLWHYTGLHVVDGRSPRKAKGQRVSWDPVARTALLQPDGIADHIVRQRVPVYRERYDQVKARLTAERGGADRTAAIEIERGPADQPTAIERLSGGADVDREIEHVDGPAGMAGEIDPLDGGAVHAAEIDRGPDPALKPFQIDAIARKVAVKAFLGDLLIALKAASPMVEPALETDQRPGPGEAVR